MSYILKGKHLFRKHICYFYLSVIYIPVVKFLIICVLLVSDESPSCFTIWLVGNISRNDSTVAAAKVSANC